MAKHDSRNAQASSLNAEIDEALAWCSYSNGHKTARLLVRLRDQMAAAWDEGFDAGEARANADYIGPEPRNPYRAR